LFKKQKRKRNYNLFRKRDQEYWKRVSEEYDDAFSIHSDLHEPGSIAYEEFEDTQIEEIMEMLVSSGPTVFVEIGSGTGRYVHKYGCKMCKSSKEGIGFNFDPRYDKNLKLIIGIDCSFPMIKKSLNRLRVAGLAGELWNRILLINAYGEESFLDLNSLRKFRDSQKVVCCVFNTLGNVEPYNRRLMILRNMRKLALPNGIVIVSVFTAETDKDFQEESVSYYTHPSVKRLIRPRSMLSFISRTVRTDDFVSHWFKRSEIESLMRKAGLEIVETIDPAKVWHRRAGTVRNRGIIIKAKPKPKSE
jgi:hypothetical protein